MSKNDTLNLIQILDTAYCNNDEYLTELTFGFVRDMNDECDFGEECYCDDYECDCMKPSISFTPIRGWSFNHIVKEEVNSYTLITSKVERYRNGRIKKSITKGGRKIRLLPSNKTRKNVKGRAG